VDSFQQPLFKNEGLKIPEVRNAVAGLLSRTSITYLFHVGKSMGSFLGWKVNGARFRCFVVARQTCEELKTITRFGPITEGDERVQ
jgi:hypothetical protein